MHRYQTLERRDRLSVSDFYRDYVGVRPVVFTPYNYEQWSSEDWSEAEICRLAGHAQVRVRPASTDYHAYEGACERMKLEEYLVYIKEWQEHQGQQGILPPYAQDTLLLREAPLLRDKFRSFPLRYLPEWYQRVWEDYPCFFFGSRGNVTPLHFDNCETHNLFFQVRGKKKFYIIEGRDTPHCYRVGWRRSKVDARQVDYNMYPRFANATVYELDIQPGEVLYMPPRTWHQTCASETNVSFNLDFHTPRSAVSGVFAVLDMARIIPAGPPRRMNRT